MEYICQSNLTILIRDPKFSIFFFCFPFLFQLNFQGLVRSHHQATGILAFICKRLSLDFFNSLLSFSFFFKLQQYGVCYEFWSLLTAELMKLIQVVALHPQIAWSSKMTFLLVTRYSGYSVIRYSLLLCIRVIEKKIPRCVARVSIRIIPKVTFDLSLFFLFYFIILLFLFPMK